MSRPVVVCTALALSLAALGPASALSSKDCSVKYQAAKSANTLNGQSWNDFRKAQCSDAAAAPAAAPAPTQAAAPAPAPAPVPAAKPAPAPAPTAAAKPATTPAASGAAVFPKAIDPKYASESAGKGRQKTCLDQYNANKAAGASGNGGMNWIQKGGGYYSECNKRLKV